MPFFHTITDVAVWIKAKGEVTFEEFSAAITRAIADARFENGLCLVLDLRYYTKAPPVENLERRVLFLAGMKEKISPVLGVIVSDELHFAISKQFGDIAKTHGFTVEIFTDEKGALAWLKNSRKK
jgi:hypothetical protein